MTVPLYTRASNASRLRRLPATICNVELPLVVLSGSARDLLLSNLLKANSRSSYYGDTWGWWDHPSECSVASATQLQFDLLVGLGRLVFCLSLSLFASIS